jgi:hypothetical protein
VGQPIDGPHARLDIDDSRAVEMDLSSGAVPPWESSEDDTHGLRSWSWSWADHATSYMLAGPGAAPLVIPFLRRTQGTIYFIFFDSICTQYSFNIRVVCMFSSIFLDHFENTSDLHVLCRIVHVKKRRKFCLESILITF